jgi:uncharacterized protein YcbX
VETRRFRPNLTLSLDRALPPGEHLRLAGGVELRVTIPTPSCAIPGTVRLGERATRAFSPTFTRAPLRCPLGAGNAEPKPA